MAHGCPRSHNLQTEKQNSSPGFLVLHSERSLKRLVGPDWKLLGLGICPPDPGERGPPGCMTGTLCVKEDLLWLGWARLA